MIFINLNYARRNPINCVLCVYQIWFRIRGEIRIYTTEIIYVIKRFTGKKDKRGLVALSDGSIIDEALLSPDLVEDSKEDEALFQQSLLNGLAGFVGNLPVQNMQKKTVSTILNNVLLIVNIFAIGHSFKLGQLLKKFKQ